MKVILYVLLLQLFAYNSYGQCKTITKKTDKFENKVVITTPLLEPVMVQKVIRPDTTYYYLNINAAASASADRKGVTLLLDDNSRLEWPDEKVEVNLNGSYYHWGTNLNARAFVGLTPEQVTILSQRRITDYRLYIFDGSLKERKGESLKEAIGCLVSAPLESVKER